MKKILILGTGNAQVDFIEFCKAQGFEVHACSYKKEGRGVNLCDVFHLVNITDVEEIKKVMIDFKIDLIYSVGSDIAMPTVSKVAASLQKMSFVDSHTAEICNDKTLLRNNLKSLNNGIYTIKHELLERVEDLNKWSIYPSIVKPAISQGQRGVNKVNNFSELENSFKIAKEISKNKKVIVEEYVEGQEISINSYILNGEPMFVFITDRISFKEFPGGIIKSHKHPISLKLDNENVSKLVSNTCNQLNILNGPVYFQIKVTQDNVLKIIEVTPRLDGCHLWRFIRELGGPDLFHVITKHFMNPEQISKSDFSMLDYKKDLISELSFFTQNPESKMNKNLHPISDNISYHEWYYEDDEIIRPINGYQEKVGYEIVLNEGSKL